jgi:hypothetical protein
MSKFLILFLFVLVSCGKDAPLNTNVGERRRMDPQPIRDANDLAAYKNICMAIANKSEMLSVSTEGEYVFSYSSKGCSESQMSGPRDIKTYIERISDSIFVFRSRSGESFPFSDVETDTTGLMSKICANLNNDLKSPIQTSMSGVMAFSRCDSDANIECVLIERGTLNGDEYTIHTKDWIKFKVTNGRRGFFVQRNQISGTSCPEGQEVMKAATLK